MSEEDFTYTMPKGLWLGLMIASTCWFSVDGMAVLPIGFVFALVTVATKYETTYFASLKTGRGVVGRTAAIAAASFVFMAVQVGISRSGIEAGIFMPLLRYLGH